MEIADIWAPRPVRNTNAMAYKRNF